MAEPQKGAGPETVGPQGGGELPDRTGHWIFVASTGLACGAIVGWLLWMLTAAIAAAFVIGAAVASILVVLAIAGARQNQTFHADAARDAEARVRRQRVLDAMRDSRRNRPPG
jgi:cobalamin synthase